MLAQKGESLDCPNWASKLKVAGCQYKGFDLLFNNKKKYWRPVTIFSGEGGEEFWLFHHEISLIPPWGSVIFLALAPFPIGS